ncbi:COG3904 family protein [Galbibacter mesophilus]|uniref:COG3904 family protein n=1 Tax=Galbibacter mesophilus TaxID=379069 RepID=UPI00191E64B0|nr:hypothetical protein [Galbibacter mesophilus]MCM5662756.1 hypothetical protein [Galbibacter mesophilus]
MTQMIYKLLVTILVFFSLNGMQAQSLKKLLKTKKANSLEKCEKKNGYWYQGKCWANFKDFDDNITKEDVDRVVAEQMEIAKDYGLSIGGDNKAVTFFMPQTDGKQIFVVTVYNENNQQYTLLQMGEFIEGKSNNLQAILIEGHIMDFGEDEEAMKEAVLAGGAVETRMEGLGDDRKLISHGEMTYMNSEKAVPFTLKAGAELVGMGDTTLEVKGDEVYLNGTLGTKSYKQFKDLLKKHPEVKTVVLQKVPGSVNDAVNMHTGRLIREAGLNTKVLPDSDIASGGVDLFCAGNERIVMQGAKLGIHSWGGDGLSAGDLPKDHPAHQYQLAYFTMCLGEEKGPDFYFLTLDSAPADGMYYMTDEEIRNWTVATKFEKKK